MLRAGIHLVVGPMFAGKSSYLLEHGGRYEAVGLRVAFVKYKGDSRGPADLISTHMESGRKATFRLSDLRPYLKELEPYDVVLIDECQFFDGLKEASQVLCDDMGKVVIMAGLRTGFGKCGFPAVDELLSVVDTISALTAICSDCLGTAYFTRHKAGILVRDSPGFDPALIGGKEMYESLCRACFNRKTA